MVVHITLTEAHLERHVVDVEGWIEGFNDWEGNPKVYRTRVWWIHLDHLTWPEQQQTIANAIRLAAFDAGDREPDRSRDWRGVVTL